MNGCCLYIFSMLVDEVEEMTGGEAATGLNGTRSRLLQPLVCFWLVTLAEGQRWPHGCCLLLTNVLLVLVQSHCVRLGLRP